MKRTLFGLTASSLLAASASAAAFSASYGWEDQDASVFGTFGNIQIDGVQTGSTTGYDGTPIASPSGADSFSVTGASEGDYYLQVSEQQHGGTPNAIIAAVYDVAVGDVINISLDGWDETSGASPSIRVWYAVVDSNGAFTASANGSISADFSPGTGGWNASTGTYTVIQADLDETDAAGIGIQLRLYSSPSTDNTLFTDFFVDNLQIDVTTSSSTASIALPNGSSIPVPEPGSLALLALGGMTMLRRRR